MKNKEKLIKFLINLIPIKKYRRHFREKYNALNQIFTPDFANSKCLLIAPHADDDVIGAGGVMLKYPNNFDCLCAQSAGIKYKEISAEQRADIRINEFNTVMNKIGIKNHWIFKTFGEGIMIDNIKQLIKEYLKFLNLSKYDYIFLPNPYDNHPEHQYIARKLLKILLKKQKYKKNLKIVFYEVWTPIQFPNYLEDITNVAKEKYSILSLYESQHVWIKYNEKIIEGLNKYRGMFANNVDYAEAFKIITVQKYLRKRF